MYYKRICNIAILATSLLVFFVWSIINDINFSSYGITGFWAVGINFVISFIVAFGFFNGFTIFTTKVILRITLVKRLILGSAYIEGVWVGFYITPKRPYLCYVTVEQNIDEPTIINGFSYSVEKEKRHLWNSCGEVSIDKNSLRFQYILTPIGVEATDDGFINYDGFANYLLYNKKRFRNPHSINGRAFNLESPIKIHTELKKYRHSPLNNACETLVAAALAFYNAKVNNLDAKGTETTAVMDVTQDTPK